MSFSCKGKQYRKPTETSNRKLAEKIYGKVLTQIAEGKWFDRAPGADKTVRELLAQYIRVHTAKNKVATSLVRDEGIAKRLNATFGDVTLDQLRPRDIAEFKMRRREEGAAANTVNNELGLLGHAYNLAMREWEWVDSNPVSRVSKEKVNNKVERWLTHDEEQRILALSPAWLREVVIFAINTGLRQGELMNLTWDRVDLFRKTLTILEQKNKGKDTLPLNAQAMEVLKARHKVRSIKSNRVFFNSEGERLDASNLRRSFYLYVEKAEVSKCRFHDLRHTFATRLVQARVDLYKVQKLMRHKSPIMTQRYAHHYPESLRDGVEVLDKNYHIFITGQEKGATANAVTP